MFPLAFNMHRWQLGENAPWKDQPIQSHWSHTWTKFSRFPPDAVVIPQLFWWHHLIFEWHLASCPSRRMTGEFFWWCLALTVGSWQWHGWAAKQINNKREHWNWFTVWRWWHIEALCVWTIFFSVLSLYWSKFERGIKTI